LKITISKSELLGSVKAPARIASRATADFLACLLIDAKDDAVTVSAMDFVESVRVSAPALVDEPGTALISARSLMGIANALPDAAVELCADESGAVITCGKSKFDIPALDPDLFPSFPEVTPEEELSIPAADFAFLSKVGGIAADSVQRNEYVAPYPILMGIVEGDNVGEIIVAEKFAVYSQNLFVITKKVIDVSDCLSVGGGHKTKPSVNLSEVEHGQLHIFCLKFYHTIYKYLYI